MLQSPISTKTIVNDITLKEQSLLTFRIKKYNDDDQDILAYDIIPGIGFTVPRAFYTWHPEFEKVNNYHFTEGEPIPFYKMNFMLRPYQTLITSWACVEAKANGGAIIHAECGAGKTVMLLNIAAMLGRVTLILVDREVLFDQWIEEITNALDVDPSVIGRVGKGFNDWRGKHFILGTVQYLTRGKFERELLSYVGTVVCDEVHLFAAPTFDRVVNVFPGRYRLGGTATINRQDGLEQMYFYNIGKVSEKAVVPPEYKVTPAIYIKPTHFSFAHKYNHWNHKPDIVSLTSDVALNSRRNQMIIFDILQSAASGRQTLVLCDRVEQRDFFESALLSHPYTVGVISQKMKTSDRKEQFSRQIILATHHIAKYGLNIPTIDCIMDVGVYSNPTRAEQSGGRSMRKVDKKDPIVVCYVDENSILKAMMRKRIKVYKMLNWTVNYL